MTARTENVYQFIKQYHARHGYAPTRREVGRACNLSTSVVSHHLGILQDAGRLTVARDVARGIVLVEQAVDEADWLAMKQAAR